MSTAIAKNLQVGTSVTATDNFTIFQPATPDGTLRIGNGNTGITTSLLSLNSSGNLIQSAPTTPPSLGTNGTMVFNLTSNTNLRVSVRGSDGVTRTANITLA